MTLRKVSSFLSAAALITLCGCASFRDSGAPKRASGIGSPLTVRLDNKGIVDEKFRTADRPPIMTNGGDLVLQDQSTEYDFDVTFILDISEATMREYLGRSDLEGGALTSQFVDGLKGGGPLVPHDVECLTPPRCEVTVQTSGSGESVTRVPYALLNLGGAKIAAFYVFLLERRGPGTDDDVYQDAPQPRGYVGLETKFVPELEIPLDNTGIDDWGFLSPRSPRILPGAPTAVETEVSKTSAPSPSLAGMRTTIAELSSASEARQNPAHLATVAAADQIKSLAEAAVRELEEIRKTRISHTSEAADSAILVIQQQGNLAVAKSFEPGGQAPSSSKCPPRPKPEDFSAPLSKALVHAITLVCESTVWAMSQVATAGWPEGTGAVELADATLQGVSAVRAIVTTSLLSNYIDPYDGGKVVPLLDKVDQIWKAAQPPIEAILRDPAITSGAKQALSRLAASQPKEELSKQSAEAAKTVEQITAEIDRFAQRQRIVRFSNHTLDRSFVVTFEVVKKNLLTGIQECPQPPDQTPKKGDALLLDCIEADYGRSIELTPTDGNVTVSFLVDPGSKVDIDAWLLSKAPKVVVPFEVDFFDQTDDPAYSKGYIALAPIDPADPTVQPESKFATNLITGFTGTYEPCFGKLDDCKGTLTDVPYNGKMKEHYSASGQVDFSQDLGNRASGKLSLQYKKSDLGIGKDDGASVPQYQINIFGTNNTTFTLGKFAFVQPSNQIAASVSGEGLRLIFKKLALSYLLSRESDDGVSDAHNKDHDVLLAQWKYTIRRSRFFRRLELVALWGEDRCKPADASVPDREGDCAVDQSTGTFKGFPHTYTTYGTELFFNMPFGASPADPRQRRLPLTGTLAVYYSEKDSRQTNPPPTDPLFLDIRDGDGTVALLTLGRPFGFVSEAPGSKKVKPTRVLTGMVGWGSGDDPETPEDEGYLGETAAFTRDQIFLTGIARRLGGRQGDLPLAGIGKGLTNKTYYSLQYTDNNTSLLGWVAELLQIDKRDIVSQSTTLSLHHYRLHEPVFNDRDAGLEADLEFRMEQPKSVKWKVAGGYFIPGDALRGVVTKEVWTVSVGVVIEPARLPF